MAKHFYIGHIPALYFAFANCIGLILAPLRGNRAVIELYGLPTTISEVTETWPVWQAGQGRTILLGLMMHYFYWRGQYAECDAMLMGVAFLGLNDFLVIFNHGDNLPWAWSRIIFSVAFASTGYFGLTQGRGRAKQA
ncbi:hypothetical protein F4821DRAFT_249066 [Hypoxylon rubiginosum]|uniref:Uncharacterized protein n=1 Tax=Hypoxylon rubiginosum TaxID=110542 RepID=A0ACC0CM35_9PEZI|nr:hypothetical protein F4821DRAFT_249066 [Hypoxylon rubiginosum]